MLKQRLSDDWTVKAISNFSEVPDAIRDATILARVPGCVHTDLLRAGLIDDPYFGQNEPKLFWIGRTDWQYTTYFDADPKLFDHERIDLVCDGLDTVATIILNGSEVARTQNMHCGYRFDVRRALKKGKNELTILFESPVNYAARMRDKLGYLPGIFYGGAYNFIRKMACNFGWDWGPVVPTCGIWKGVRLEGWSRLRIKAVRPRTNLSEGEATVEVEVDLDLAGELSSNHKWELGMRAGKDDKFQWTVLENTVKTATAHLIVNNPLKWWPFGYGDQALYVLQVYVTATPNQNPNQTETQDVWARRVALRTVELDTHPDDIGQAFVLKVNGKPIFCKGFNWIPDDCFLDRACTPERYRKRIQQALDANANMLRVWGGGIYETDEFYDICDETGMLVWQDFPFACAAYPEAEPFKSEVEAEAKYNVARLAHHPSLVLWNGCNENVWMYHKDVTDDGTGKLVKWKEQLAGKQWGQGYYFDLLPKIVKEIDPSRPYWAASPWSGDPDYENGLEPNLSTHGNKHIWEVWHGPGDYNNYRWFSPRFCSEFGYQGPPNYTTLACAIAKEELHRGSKSLELHQKSPGGNARNEKLLLKDFDIPDNYDDYHYLLQINQARALTAGVEWFRSRQPVCMGTLYWQLNDCYPVTSWSAIDSDGRLKPLWYATRRFYQPRLLTIQPEADVLVLYANNDSDEPWRGQVQIRRMDFAGKELAIRAVQIDVPPRSNLRAAILPTAIASPRDPSREFVIARVDDSRALWYFARDRELNYPRPNLRCSFAQGRLTISTDALVRDLTINIDRLDPDGMVDDNFVTLLPGETREFGVWSNAQLDVMELTAPPVLQCANWFGKPDPSGSGAGSVI
ncbi:MAG TPA: glycoside hydrolase family 2 TIM barrel-domain containing protein [Tepidisphaeraceae bacterium]|nr:glycoside hydrolase family 2 TIM barrel-domain containing protein [Tepidisphaeraceae bacterium]